MHQRTTVRSGGCLNTCIKMSSYRYRDSNYTYKSVPRPSYLCNENPIFAKTVIIFRRDQGLFVSGVMEGVIYIFLLWHIYVQYRQKIWNTWKAAQWKHSYPWFAGNGLAPVANKVCGLKATLMCGAMDEKCNLQYPKWKIHNSWHVTQLGPQVNLMWRCMSGDQ